MDREHELLFAAYELLKKQRDSFRVLDILETKVSYDDCICDGYCLMEDIAKCLSENNIEVNE